MGGLVAAVVALTADKASALSDIDLLCAPPLYHRLEQ